MSSQAFQDAVAQGYNRIPLVAEHFADLDTPLSLFVKLANCPHSFLLESVVGGERFGRYSFIGLPARTRLEVRGQNTSLFTDGQLVESSTGDPLAFIENYRGRFKVPPVPGLPSFCGGLAGYFGYDTVRLVEPRLQAGAKPDDLGIPDILLMLTDRLAVLDNLKGKIYLIVYADPAQANAYENAKAELEGLRARLRAPVVLPLSHASLKTPVERVFPKADFLQAVAKCKQYIAAGDVMQVVIGQRLSKRFEDSPLSLYRALRSLNPSPYMFYYDMGDHHVVGSSPEILVRQEDRDTAQAATETIVTVRPIAGTRPRGKTAQQDAELADELLADPKEIAEHVMLIDLARNDVGRIAKTGSVKVTEQLVIERYSHVMHIVSNVEGHLQPGLSAMDVLKATFPAGTLSGAPKVRAMEIVDELEPTKRGVYGGACGYWSFSGAMDVAIAIRSGVIKNGVLYAQAGAGIVADSVAESEWLETENKAAAVMRAAEQVQEGLDR
ncbi:MAG: anthranilate synthase component I [Burkholderiales bacterium]|nr:anthranilate synthase component I [Burkholderiales bacterium]